jgi:hypothetical protein
MVFIASNKKLPTIEWNNVAPDFYVHELKELDYCYKEIRNILSKKYLYDVGAHSGCGCGFNYVTYEPLNEDDIREDLKGRNSVNRLFHRCWWRTCGLSRPINKGSQIDNFK